MRRRGIAITDDDAAPHGDWLAHIETHFCQIVVWAVVGAGLGVPAHQLEDGARR